MLMSLKYGCKISALANYGLKILLEEIHNKMRIANTVKGQTELEFCNSVIRPLLSNINTNVSIHPIIITTSNKSGKFSKGGSIKPDRIINEINKLLHSFDFVTTFYDILWHNRNR